MVILVITIEAFLLGFLPIVRANGGSIPEDYYQNLDLNGLYVYNVTAFGTEWGWYNYTWGLEGNFLSNPGGQIHLNLTGFHDRDPYDSGAYCDFPDTNMPWMAITIFNRTGTGLDQNFKIENRSNSEVASQLMLNFFGFTSGFLVPLNTTWLNNTAQGAAAGVADLTVEETFNFIYFDFDQTSGTQRTQLLYDKTTGLLVWANTSLSSYGYSLEIQSLNFSYNYDESYVYDVDEFSATLPWYDLNWSSRGDVKAQPGNQIIVNITGFYQKNVNDSSPFPDPAPYININFVGNTTFYNISNAEAACALTIGYNNFLSGFMIPMDNLTWLKEIALQEAEGVYCQGVVIIQETSLTIKIKFGQTNGVQTTYMIYEKKTGVLLWANTYTGGYTLEITINGYVPWVEESGVPSPSGPVIEFIPYLAIILASVIVGVPFEFAPRLDNKPKKIILIGIIGISSFSVLFFFNNNMDALIGGPRTSQFKENVANITLIVDYNNGTIEKWENFTLDNYKTSVYDALDKYYTVTLEYSAMGYFVKSIDGVSIPWVYDMTDKDGNQLYGIDVTKQALDDGYTIHFH